MKLNKILSLILSVILVLGAVSVFSFAEEAETVYGKESLGIINALGIAEYTSEQLGENITRAELLKMLAIAAGYGEMKSEEVLFADLALENEYEPYIKALVKLGAVKGDSKGNIYPDGEIGLIEAASVAVKLTGYGMVAEARGGYPSGYYSVAKMNEILKGLPSSQYTVLTKGMALKLVENTLKADLMVQTGFGSEITFEEKNGENFLWTVFSVRYLEGIVEGVDISRIAGVNDVTPFWIDIDGFEIEAKDVENPRQYLGYKVDAYYSDERSDIPKLVWIEKSDKNTENIFAAEDVVSISGTKINVQDETGKEKSYSFKKSIPVIYNGTSTAQSLSMALISGKYGNVRLIDNNGDKAADVAVLDIFDNYVVSQVDAVNYVIYDEYNPAKKITLNTKEDNPYVIIYAPNGEETSINDINKGSIVCVFESAPDSYQKFIRAYIMDNTVEGTITRTKNNGDKIIIGDAEYELNELCKTNCSKLVKPGQAVKLYMDYAGNVAYIKKSEGDVLSFGYLIATDPGEGLSAQLKVKIFTLDEEFKIIDGAKKIKLDGELYNGDDAAILTRLKAASKVMFPAADADCVAQIFRYGLNEEGQLSTVDTLINGITKKEATRYESDTMGDSLFSATNTKSDLYRSSYRTLGPNIAMSTTTEMIMYPSPVTADINDEDKYLSDLARNILVNDQNNYDARAFFTGSDQFYTEFICCADNGNANYPITAGTQFAVVKEYIEVYDAEKDEIRDSLVLLTINGEQTIKVEEGFTFKGIDNEAAGLYPEMTVDQLVEGDVVRYRADNRGRLKTLDLNQRVDKNYGDITVTPSRDSAYGQAITIRKGIVYDTFENGFLAYYPSDENLFTSKDLSKVTPAECELVVGTGAASVYYVYEEGRAGEMEASITDMSKLKSYKETGTDCSKILIQTYYGSPRAVLIY